MKYTESHEWIESSDETATIGITQHAQSQLGDIVYVELPKLGVAVKAGEEVAVLESTKAAADVYAPISGVITAINDALKEHPELVNHSPEKEGWILKIKPTSPEEIDSLLDKNSYLSQLNKI